MKLIISPLLGFLVSLIMASIHWKLNSICIFFYMEREGINLDSDSNRNAKNCFYLEFADIQIWLVHDSSNIDLHLKFFTKFNINSWLNLPHAWSKTMPFSVEWSRSRVIKILNRILGLSLLRSNWNPYVWFNWQQHPKMYWYWNIYRVEHSWLRSGPRFRCCQLYQDDPRVHNGELVLYGIIGPFCAWKSPIPYAIKNQRGATPLDAWAGSLRHERAGMGLSTNESRASTFLHQWEWRTLSKIHLNHPFKKMSLISEYPWLSFAIKTQLRTPMQWGHLIALRQITTNESRPLWGEVKHVISKVKL